MKHRRLAEYMWSEMTPTDQWSRVVRALRTRGLKVANRARTNETAETAIGMLERILRNAQGEAEEGQDPVEELQWYLDEIAEVAEAALAQVRIHAMNDAMPDYSQTLRNALRRFVNVDPTDILALHLLQTMCRPLVARD